MDPVLLFWRWQLLQRHAADQRNAIYSAIFLVLELRHGGDFIPDPGRAVHRPVADYGLRGCDRRVVPLRDHASGGGTLPGGEPLNGSVFLGPSRSLSSSRRISRSTSPAKAAKSAWSICPSRATARPADIGEILFTQYTLPFESLPSFYLCRGGSDRAGQWTRPAAGAICTNASSDRRNDLRYLSNITWHCQPRFLPWASWECCCVETHWSSSCRSS